MHPAVLRYKAHLWVGGASLLALTACVPYASPAPATVRLAPSIVQPAMEHHAAVQPAANLSTDVKITATEFKFQPSAIQVPAGEKVKFTLENKGAIEHDMTLETAGFTLVAKAGQTATGEFTFDKPGQYQLICSIPGHEAAGMKGTLTVGAAAPSEAPALVTKALAPAEPTAKPLPAGLTAVPQPQVAPPVTWTSPRTHQVTVETTEIPALLADGVGTTLWTFNGTVPGPMLRVRQGDTVELTLKNSPNSKATHSIDLHAVTGPGGGAKGTQVPPGGEATFTFKALNPGVYVYHCATPMVAHHIASGMYGLIVVEPEGGLPKVDREFYVMQGDMYLQGERGEQGLREFSMDKMLDERPDYVVFNGSTGALVNEGALKAKVGETVRIFFGDGGPNLTSSFHVIGEVFDRVYPEGSSDPVHNVQTTLVPAGGATIVDFKLEVPGTYMLVDHSLGRLEKGGAGMLEVEGPENPEVFHADHVGAGGTGGH